MNEKRLSDGTFRGNNQATKPSPRTIRARWVESEVLKLKLLGISTFHAIAQQIAKVGRGQAQPVVEFPPGISFPHGYSITAVACCRACKRALARCPRLKAIEMRDLDTDRLEEGILATRKGIKHGDPSALRNLTQLITAKARLNGYIGPRTLELTRKSGGSSEVKRADDGDVTQMLQRLTREEQIEFMRLYNKARGVLMEPTETKVEERKADEETNESREEDDSGSDPTAR